MCHFFHWPERNLQLKRVDGCHYKNLVSLIAVMLLIQSIPSSFSIIDSSLSSGQINWISPMSSLLIHGVIALPLLLIVSDLPPLLLESTSRGLSKLDILHEMMHLIISCLRAYSMQYWQLSCCILNRWSVVKIASNPSMLNVSTHWIKNGNIIVKKQSTVISCWKRSSC